MKIDNSLFNKSIVHDSGAKHVSGLAKYTDDISEPLNTLYGAIGWSKNAHAKIKKIDLNAVKNNKVCQYTIPASTSEKPAVRSNPAF